MAHDAPRDDRDALPGCPGSGDDQKSLSDRLEAVARFVFEGEELDMDDVPRNWQGARLNWLIKFREQRMDQTIRVVDGRSITLRALQEQAACEAQAAIARASRR